MFYLFEISREILYIECTFCGRHFCKEHDITFKCTVCCRIYCDLCDTKVHKDELTWCGSCTRRRISGVCICWKEDAGSCDILFQCDMTHLSDRCYKCLLVSFAPSRR